MRTMRNSRMLRIAGAGGIGKTMWRLLITPRSGDDVAMNRVEFRAESGGAAVTSTALSEIIYRSFATSEKTNNQVKYAFLPDATSWFSDAEAIPVLGWRFDDPVEINEITWKNTGSSSDSARAITVQSSSNGGKDWDDEWSESGLTITSNATVVSTRP